MLSWLRIGKNELYLHSVLPSDWIIPGSNRGAGINSKGEPHSQTQCLSVIGKTLPHVEQL